MKLFLMMALMIPAISFAKSPAPIGGPIQDPLPPASPTPPPIGGGSSSTPVQIQVRFNSVTSVSVDSLGNVQVQGLGLVSSPSVSTTATGGNVTLIFKNNPNCMSAAFAAAGGLVKFSMNAQALQGAVTSVNSTLYDIYLHLDPNPKISSCVVSR